LFFQLIVSFIFQVFLIIILYTKAWYIPKTPDQDEHLNSETTCLFILNSFQTLNSAVAYSISYPFRKPIYKNSKNY
jgi:hypothetical protein